MSEVALDDFLRAEGFTTDAARAEARAVLEADGLTNPRKRAMVTGKLPRARAALDARLLRVCGDDGCHALVPPNERRRTVAVDRDGCSVCGGSNNRRALRALSAACHAAGVSRLLVVGGTRAAHVEMRDTLGGDPDVRFVDGTQKLPKRTDAERDCAWADCVVIWAPTPLPHKVSDLYARESCVAPRHVTVHRRGLEDLAKQVVAHLSRAPRPGAARPA